MMKFDWVIARLKKNNSGSLPGLVTEVQWHVIGTDENGKSSWFAGAFPTEEPDPKKFVDFEKLTRDQVIQWVMNHVENHKLYNLMFIEEQIRQKIELEDIEEVNSDDFPWSVRP